MVRNTACEGSDGCAAAVLERLVLGPGQEGQERGRASLTFWLGRDLTREDSAPVSDTGEEPPLQMPFPTFETGGWRFIVRTRDLRLIDDLKAFAREIADQPRADRKFTSRLIRCTEEGNLGGWAWEKERVEVS